MNKITKISSLVAASTLVASSGFGFALGIAGANSAGTDLAAILNNGEFITGGVTVTAGSWLGLSDQEVADLFAAAATPDAVLGLIEAFDVFGEPVDWNTFSGPGGPVPGLVNSEVQVFPLQADGPFGEFIDATAYVILQAGSNYAVFQTGATFLEDGDTPSGATALLTPSGSTLLVGEVLDPVQPPGVPIAVPAFGLVEVIPEPSVIALLFAGVAGLFVVVRRRK